MFADIMTSVTGRRYKAASAVLYNYRRLTVRNEDYPGIVPHKGAAVTGMVYFNLEKQDWQRLDVFEGRMYRRKTIEVALADGTEAMAQAYVVRPEYAYRLGPDEWSAAEFRRFGKKRFQTQYQGYDKLNPTNDKR
jgi:hypothetical protein